MLRRLLLRYPLCGIVAPRAFDAWLADAQEMHLAAGEELFHQGSVGEWLYVVSHGSVRIMRKSKTGGDITVGIAGPGDLFGEYALLKPHLNTATCRARTDAGVFRLPLTLLRSELPEVAVTYIKRWTQLHALVQCLRGGPFVGFMSAPSALAHMQHLEPATYSAGLTIQAKGLADGYWFFIERGRVELQMTDGSVSRIAAGDCFGELALIEGKNLPVAIAVQDTNCLQLSRDEFYHPGIETQSAAGQTVFVDRAKRNSHVWIGQQKNTDCGMAALKMISRHYSLPWSLAKGSECSKESGLSILDLQRLATAAGMSSRTVRVDSRYLSDVRLPAIAHYSSGHYVVLFECRPGAVVIGDPATSIHTVSELQFWREASGYMLLLEPA